MRITLSDPPGLGVTKTHKHTAKLHIMSLQLVHWLFGNANRKKAPVVKKKCELCSICKHSHAVPYNNNLQFPLTRCSVLL